MASTEWLFHPLFPGQIGIWEFWFLWREENQITQRKTLGAGTRTNNKLSPHIIPSLGIRPWENWWEASALTTAPSLLPKLTIIEHLFTLLHFYTDSILYIFIIILALSLPNKQTIFIFLILTIYNIEVTGM